MNMGTPQFQLCMDNEKTFDNMEERERNFSGKNSMTIRISEYTNSTLSGQIYSLYYKEPIYFTSVADMILKINAVCDILCCPQASMSLRTISAKYQYDSGLRAENVIEKPVIHGAVGKSVFSFGLYIMFRQHASMQGQITINKKRIRFRSSLELMQMIVEKLESIK